MAIEKKKISETQKYDKPNSFSSTNWNDWDGMRTMVKYPHIIMYEQQTKKTVKIVIIF